MLYLTSIEQSSYFSYTISYYPGFDTITLPVAVVAAAVTVVVAVLLQLVVVVVMQTGTANKILTDGSWDGNLSSVS